MLDLPSMSYTQPVMSLSSSAICFMDPVSCI